MDGPKWKNHLGVVQLANTPMCKQAVCDTFWVNREYKNSITFEIDTQHRLWSYFSLLPMSEGITSFVICLYYVYIMSIISLIHDQPNANYLYLGAPALD